MEQINETRVVGLVLAVQFQQFVDASFHEDSVVGGGQPEPVLAVPAVLPAPLLRAVHQVVQHQEEGLKLGGCIGAEGWLVMRLFVGLMLRQSDKCSMRNSMSNFANC